jgi:hypothetical protein
MSLNPDVLQREMEENARISKEAGMAAANVAHEKELEDAAMMFGLPNAAVAVGHRIQEAATHVMNKTVQSVNRSNDFITGETDDHKANIAELKSQGQGLVVLEAEREAREKFDNDRARPLEAQKDTNLNQ